MSIGRHRSWRNAAMLLVVVLALWQLAYWSIGEVALRSPAETIAFTAKLIGTASFAPHAAESLKAFALALAIAVLSGLAIGFALGLNRLTSDVLEPVLVTLYSIPKITLYPILLLIFGLGMPAKVAFGAIHGVIPVALFTIAAVQNIRPVLLKSARMMKLKRLELIRRVLLPAAIPEIFTGLRVGFALTLIGTLLGEMFAAQRGIGFLLMNAIGLHNIDLIMGLTFLITLFAGAASGLLLYLDRRFYARA
jgi:NitT/TauT family transport system permease protein